MLCRHVRWQHRNGWYRNLPVFLIVCLVSANTHRAGGIGPHPHEQRWGRIERLRRKIEPRTGGGQKEIDSGMWGWERTVTWWERKTKLKKYLGIHAHTHKHAHTYWNLLSGYGRLHSLIVLAGEMCHGWWYQLEMSNGLFKYVWHTCTHASVRTTEEDKEGENEKIWRKN